MTPGSLRALAAAPFSQWDRVLVSVDDALDPRLLGLVRSEVSAALGEGSAARVVEDDTRLCRALVEQFVVDVGSTPDALRAAALGVLVDQAFAFVQACYVTDMDSRLRAAWRQLFEVQLEAAPVGRTAVDLWSALEEFMRSVARLHSLDPLTTEIVRLRGARAHRCRLCQSLRSVRAANEGVDETVYDQIDIYETSALAERHKVALRLVDAFLWQPLAYPPGLAGQVVDEFSPGGTVELVLDIARNAANKIAVLFGADAPHVTDGVEYYDIDAAGELVYGRSLG